MARLKKETGEVKRGEPSVRMCAYVCVRAFAPPLLPSKSQGRLIAFQG